MIEFHLNGAPRTLSAPCSIAQLLQDEGLALRRVAVERNGQIVPRSQHDSVHVGAGDRVEVVQAMGGG